MRFELYLAKRFLAGQRFGVFRLVTTVIAIGGTALGVASLLITLAVMDGFRTDIQEKILGTQPHIIVKSPSGEMVPWDPSVEQKLQGIPAVQAEAPFISAQALLQTNVKVTGILLRGIRPDQEQQVTRLAAILTDGRWKDLNDHTIVLGEELAQSVEARPGDTVTLIAPQPEATTWMQMPRMRRYVVVGLVHSGMYESDSNLAYVTIKAAQDLLGTGPAISGYGVRLRDLDTAAATAHDIQSRLGDGFWTFTWQDMYRPLFSAMKLERTVMFIILTLIIVVSSFTIISNLLLLTIEKAREIGILQALGASPRQVGKIFLFNGLLLGGSGVTLGLALGAGISAALKRFPIIKLPADVYYIDRLPVRLSAHMVESVALCAFVLVLAAVLYPAWKASEMDPVQAIRYG
ncbi:MAG TPA: ABC transporter permease [Elusimicrobiota bacterium]|nr:ABC transporter permease [Elusimicrobiota bacterium]